MSPNPSRSARARRTLSRVVRVEAAQRLPLPADLLAPLGLAPGSRALFLVEPLLATGSLSLCLLGDRIDEVIVPRIPPARVLADHPEIWDRPGLLEDLYSEAGALGAGSMALLCEDGCLAIPEEFVFAAGGDFLLQIQRSRQHPRLLVHPQAAAPGRP
jgi:hypothetical protein